jgi:ketosteroid isomerase-like protein
LRASGFATNTLQWAPAIRAGKPVRAPYLYASRSLIHEQDIADVAALAMTSPGHDGRAYALTGPAAITQAEQVRLIGAAAGVPVSAEEASHDEARAEMLSWAKPGFADAALGYWASLVATPEPVTDTVRELTGSPARPFAQWARDHAADFRPLPIEEVARRYVEAFRAGRMDRALALTDPGLVRVAPAETGGERKELRGLADIMANAERLTADLDIHAVAVDGPFLGDDRFAVRFTFDQTHRPTGQRTEATKLSLYTVAGGAIVREEVNYFDAPAQPR